MTYYYEAVSTKTLEDWYGHEMSYWEKITPVMAHWPDSFTYLNFMLGARERMDSNRA